MLAIYPIQGIKRRSKTPVANFPLTIKPPFKNSHMRIFGTAFEETETGIDIATSEPDTEAAGAATEAGFQMLTGAAE